MFDKRITRKEFLKTGVLGFLAILAMPLLKIFGRNNNVSYKDARHYKKLAG